MNVPRVGRIALRISVAAAILALLAWRVGAGPFIDGLRLIDARTLAVALTLGAVTTVCCAWRWRAVSRGLGVDVTLAHATAAYYRSVFLNTVLPLGIAGDVHRAVSHGRWAGDGRAVRSVAWERAAGQAIQIALTVVVLVVLPSPLQEWMPLTAVAIVGVVGLMMFTTRRHSTSHSWFGRVVTVAREDVRQGLVARATWPVIVVASVVIMTSNVTMLVVAARTAGADQPVIRLIAVALIILAAMSIPLSLAGWGPREGVAAWTFAAIGLGAGTGITTAVVYGVMVLAASLPGAAILLAERVRTPPSTEVVHG